MTTENTNPLDADGVVAHVALYYRDGSSDKVYLAAIKAVDGGHVVEFAYGRRGSTLKTGVKTSAPVDLPAAEKIYTKLVGEKTAKGYVPDANGLPFRHSDLSDRVSGYNCQLLNPIDRAAAEALITDDDWVMQEKFDGVRMMLHAADGAAAGINRKGLFVSLPVAVEDEIKGFSDPFVIDGEAVGDTHHAFDILTLKGVDLRGETHDVRHTLLEGFLARHNTTAVKLAPTAFTTAEKRALLQEVEARGGEGVVFKRADALYVPGRPASGGNQVKFKLWESATVRVAALNNQRSVAVELFNGTAWVPAGNVTVPANHALPKAGDLVEVRYLYAYPESGALYQPAYLGPRTDLVEADAHVRQLKYKS